MLTLATEVPIAWAFYLVGAIIMLFLCYMSFVLREIKNDFRVMSNSIVDLSNSVSILLTEKDNAKRDIEMIWTELRDLRRRNKDN